MTVRWLLSDNADYLTVFTELEDEATQFLSFFIRNIKTIVRNHAAAILKIKLALKKGNYNHFALGVYGNI